MEKPEILCSVNATWCATTANAAFAMVGGPIFIAGTAAFAVYNLPALAAAKVGGGALVPITSFGHLLMHGAMAETTKIGIMAIPTGVFSLTASGISTAIVFSFFFALIFKPKN